MAVLLLIVFLRPRGKTFDKRILFDKNYKTPYGLYLAYNLLPQLFPGSSIKENMEQPGDWYNSDSSADGKGAFFLISGQFNPSTDDLNTLYNFARAGNDVFICSPEMNETAKVYFGFGEEYNYNYGSGSGFVNDSGQVRLLRPPYATDTEYFNPGYHFTTHFFGVDSLHYSVLGKDESGYPNFIRVEAGKGSFYFHSNPLLFTNYFLLYHNNLSYFERAASLLAPDKKKIIWDEYYLYHATSETRAEHPSPFRVLWSIAAFRWAFSIILILLLLYIVLGLKMLQRAVPLFARPKNETLEFTKTIGRLYFEKGDSGNLAKKMATYMLEHIRNRYFIKTTELDDGFIKNLASKSGYDEEAVKTIVADLVYIQEDNHITEKQLAQIYASFSKFYKHTF